jgi:triphosphoribosyl-dephospho-CoA synthase
MNLHRILELSSWDSIARELITGMEITFNIGYPAIKKNWREFSDLRGSILRCFFEILSNIPDTLIERKNNSRVALEVSEEAKAILEKGLKPEDISAFDSKLRSNGNRYNPGTTADLTASSIMLALLDNLYTRS